jgi:hypothetical protein
MIYERKANTSQFGQEAGQKGGSAWVDEDDDEGDGQPQCQQQ